MQLIIAICFIAKYNQPLLQYCNMQVDHKPFPVHALKLNNPKVLIRPDKVEKANGKIVVIGEEWLAVPDAMKVKKELLEKAPQETLKNSALWGQSKSKDASASKTGLTGFRISLTIPSRTAGLALN